MDREPRSFYERPLPHGSSERRLFLLSYHFPPDNAAGALRWQKFAKYAAALGWSVDVIMQDPADLVSPDLERLGDLPDGIRIFGVHQPVIWAERVEQRLWEALRDRSRPAAAFAETDPRPALPSSFARDELRFDPLSPRSWFRAYHGWAFYAANRAWARGAAALARQLFRPGVHHAVVSCGPPHGAHEGGRLLARATGLPFVMDLRDTWSLVERWSEEVASPSTPRIASRHERAAVREAALVVMNTEPAREAMQALYPEHADRILAVMNGFDDDEALPPSPAGERFRVAYAGTIYIDRNPRTLFLAAARVVRELDLGPKDFAIELMGQVESLDGLSLEQIAATAGIGEFVRVHAPGTRQAAAAFLATASVLVSLPQDSHMAIPSKVFEYMRYEASLLALAEPRSATAQLLRDTPADVVRPGDVDGLAGVLRRRYLDHRDGRRPERIACDLRFSRRAQAERFFALIDGVLAGPTETIGARRPPIR